VHGSDEGCLWAIKQADAVHKVLRVASSHIHRSELKPLGLASVHVLEQAPHVVCLPDVLASWGASTFDLHLSWLARDKRSALPHRSGSAAVCTAVTQRWKRTVIQHAEARV
jgi:hypothetical protein